MNVVVNYEQDDNADPPVCARGYWDRTCLDCGHDKMLHMDGTCIDCHGLALVQRKYARMMAARGEPEPSTVHRNTDARPFDPIIRRRWWQRQA